MEQWLVVWTSVEKMTHEIMNPAMQLLIGIALMTMLGTIMSSLTFFASIWSNRTHPQMQRMDARTPPENGFETANADRVERKSCPGPASQSWTTWTTDQATCGQPCKVYGRKEEETGGYPNPFDELPRLPTKKGKNNRPRWKTGVLKPDQADWVEDSQGNSSKECSSKVEDQEEDEGSSSKECSSKVEDQEEDEEPEPEGTKKKGVTPMTRLGLIFECMHHHPGRVLPGSNAHAVYLTCRQCRHHFTWRLQDGVTPPFDAMPCHIKIKLCCLWVKQCTAAGRPHA